MQQVRIIVEIEGGNVVNVYADNAVVVILDHDNIRGGAAVPNPDEPKDWCETASLAQGWRACNHVAHRPSLRIVQRDSSVG